MLRGVGEEVRERKEMVERVGREATVEVWEGKGTEEREGGRGIDF